MDVNLLLVTRFTNISSHSVGSLFTLLMVFFDAQKFLLFMSSLSVFTFVTCAFGVMFKNSAKFDVRSTCCYFKKYLSNHNLHFCNHWLV